MEKTVEEKKEIWEYRKASIQAILILASLMALSVYAVFSTGIPQRMEEERNKSYECRKSGGDWIDIGRGDQICRKDKNYYIDEDLSTPEAPAK